ncbi:MAG: hypothetical protein RR626_02305 [Anaerovoracaceae bacterium]
MRLQKKRLLVLISLTLALAFTVGGTLCAWDTLEATATFTLTFPSPPAP